MLNFEVFVQIFLSQQKKNDTNLKKITVGTFFATCTVNGYPVNIALDKRSSNEVFRFNKSISFLLKRFFFWPTNSKNLSMNVIKNIKISISSFCFQVLDQFKSF